MIPDFPEEKERLMKFWTKYLSAKHKEFLGSFGGFATYRIHEGHQWSFRRTDGSEDSQQYQDIQEQLEVEFSEVPNLGPDEIREKLDKVAEKTARQEIRVIFSEIDRAIRETGNEVNAHGQPLSKELFLQTIERMDMDFDEKGDWIPPTIFMHPDLWEAKKNEIRSWETDSEFQMKHNAIIDRKKEEWCDRENRRKLVD